MSVLFGSFGTSGSSGSSASFAPARSATAGRPRVTDLRSDGGPAPVPPWQAAPGGGDILYVALHVHGSVAVLHEGAHVPLEPGDIMFCDPRPLDSPRFGEQFRMTVFHVPRGLLEISDSELRRVMGVPLRCAEGLGALASHFLSALAAEPEVHRSHLGARLVGNAVEILATLVTEFVTAEAEAEAAAERGAAAPASGATTLSRIRTYIELRLTDPELSPRSIACAHHISVRYLHKLFRSEGTTVGQWIRRRRLEACRFELGRSPSHRLTVTAVAHRWGFVSASHFSRAFREAYGMSPGEWRAVASPVRAPGGPRTAGTPAPSGRESADAMSFLGA